MNNIAVSKPEKILHSLVSILVAADGFSALAIGLIYLAITYASDPLPLGADKSHDILIAKIVAWSTFGYLVVCPVALIYWNNGAVVAKYLLVGLAAMHFAGSVYLFVLVSHLNLFLFLVYSSLLVNLLLIMMVIYDIGKSKSRDQSHSV